MAKSKLAKQAIRLLSPEEALERWLERADVSDPGELQNARQILQDWMAKPRHQLFTSDAPAADEGNTCARLRLRLPQPDKPVWLYLFEDNKVSRMGVFELREPRHEDLRGKTPLQLAGMATDSDFGSRFFGWGQKGEWHHDLTPRLRRHLLREAARHGVAELIGRLSEGHGLPGDLEEIVYAPEVMDEFQPLASAALRWEQRQMHRVVHGFMRRLDPNALRLMTHDRNCLSYVYEWLSGRTEDVANFRRPCSKAGPDAIARRQKAYEAFPAFFHVMASGSKKLRDAIEQGIPFEQAYRDHAEGQVSPAVMEHVRGLITRQVDPKFRGCSYDNAYYFHWDGCLPFAGSLPHKWWPTRPAHWQGFVSLSYSVKKWADLTGRPNRDVVTELCNLALSRPEYGLPVRGNLSLPDYLNLLGRSRMQSVSSGGNVEDFMNRLVDQIALPAVFQEAARQGCSWTSGVLDGEQFDPLTPWYPTHMKQLVFKGMTLTKVFAASDRWHERTTRLRQLTDRLNPDFQQSWPALVNGPLTSPKGVQIRCLTTTAELVEEGDRMSHCVGGYGYQCMFENTHIFSLVAQDGASSGTLSLKHKGNTVSKGQLEGPVGHRTPGEEIQTAARWLINGINSGAIPLNTTQLDQFRAERDERLAIDRYEMVLQRIGFDPHDADAHNAAYHSWRIEFPGIFRESACADYLARIGATAFAQKQVGKHKAGLAHA